VVFFAFKVLGLLLLWLASGHERTERAEAARRLQEERDLMSHYDAAGPEVVKRLGAWLEPRGELLLMHEGPDSFEPYALHVLPLDAPWRASCGPIGLEVAIGGFRKDLTSVALDERQCDALLTVVGKALSRTHD
jgi:hypothetical protein